MSECLFCRIAQGEIEAETLFQDEQLMVIRDINAQAPVHLLVLPKTHFRDLAETAAIAPRLLSALLAECARLGQELGGQDGYRVVVNSGPHGGQTVPHLHFHVLAGREFQWPPG